MNKALNHTSLLPPNAAGKGVLVSVVIPVYKSAAYIVHTLESVLSQTFTDYEVILVNDGSPDTEIMERIVQPYLPHVRYIKHENRGPSGARNTAILAARGKYLAFLDSDDLWLPHHLANQVGILEKDPSLGLVYAALLLIIDNPSAATSSEGTPQPSSVTFEALIREDSRISTSSTVASRQDVLDTGLFDEHLTRCEDFDLWLRMAHRGVRMNYNSEVQVCHRPRNGLAADSELMKRARIQVYEKIAVVSPLSEIQRALIRKKIADTEVELHVELAKKSLLAREFSDALVEIQEASVARQDWKLRVGLIALRWFPRSLRQSYRGYARFLEFRQHMNVGRSVKDQKLAGLNQKIQSLWRNVSK